MRFNYLVFFWKSGYSIPRRFLQNIRQLALVCLLLLGYTAANAQVVISEVFANNTFKLTNTGNSTMDITSYWICNFPDYISLGDASINVECGSLNLAAGAEVVLSTTGLYTTDNSELGLYTNSSFSSAAGLISYLEWGGTGHERAGLAIGNGIWDGAAAPAFGNTESLTFTGDGTAAADWSINTNPQACSLTPPPAATSSARYRVTFEAVWSSSTHPTDYPSNAHFSGLIGLSHTANVALFELGAVASAGIVSMAETGSKNPLDTEIQGLITSGQGQTLISGGGINPSPGLVSVEFDIDNAHPLVSLTSMIAPSPDWFVGVRDINLFENGDWVSSLSMQVGVYDAGSDSGATFASSNQATSPIGNISMITDGPLAVNGSVASMGTMTFQRIDTAPTCDAVGGALTGGPFTFCVGDGVADFVPASSIGLSGSSGENSKWVVTLADGTIGGLPPMPSAVNFDDSGDGVCTIWHISYDDGLTGLEMGQNINNLVGCYNLSNGIQVTRNQPEGGTLTGGPFTFCVGDGIADNVPAGSIALSGNAGPNSKWVVTLADGTIGGLPPMPSAVDFDGSGDGVCTIWNISYEDGLTGLEMGQNINNLDGCYSLSNGIQVTRNQPNGGTLTGGPFTFCVGDGVADNIPAGSIALNGNAGANSKWVVTLADGTIGGLPPMPSVVDFDGSGDGVCTIWNISYEDGLTGLEVGQNISNLSGCYSLSNGIQVTRNQPNGGTLTGGPFTFCVGDGVADNVPAGSIALNGNAGANSKWVVTLADGTIGGLPPMPSAVDFDGSGVGVCKIWNISYEDGLTGLEMGQNIGDLVGCYSLSNGIEVNRQDCGSMCTAEGGTLTGGPFTFCVGDGIADNVPAGSIALSGNAGANSKWVVTLADGTIGGLPPMPSAVDFDGSGDGVCTIWNISYEDGLTGLEMGQNINNLDGCYSLSNGIQVTRNQPEGGTLIGGPFTFCVGDGIADNVPAGSIALSGNAGANSKWVVTLADGTIGGLPPMPSAVDFDGSGDGVCTIWNISYEDGLTGLEMGQNINNLDGCYSLSNGIQVTRNQPEGGTLTGGPFTFCVGDGVADNVPAGAIALSGNAGANSKWVVTLADGTIGGLPPMPSAVDFDGSGVGVCKIWNISYEDGLTGLEMGQNIGDLVGCYSLSNGIEVNRQDCGSMCTAVGGTLTGGPFTFCVGDGVADNVPAGSIALSGNAGANSKWVVTLADGTIGGLPPMPSAVDFDGSGDGVCTIWNISYEDGLTGLEMGQNINNLDGCYSLSNGIQVTRNQPEGGILTGGPFTFCVGDGVADKVAAGSIALSGNAGANSKWVVTLADGTIGGLPPMPSAVDFDGSGVGVCKIWNISYEDGLTGLEMGQNIGDLVGCYSLSNGIEVNRLDCMPTCNVVAGTISTSDRTSICVDGIGDPINITITGGAAGTFGWVITDLQKNILGLPMAPPFDLDGAGAGTCVIYRIGYDAGLTGLAVGSNLNDLQGCYALSNSIEVVRQTPDGGTVSTQGNMNEVTRCAGDVMIPVKFSTTATALSYWYIITDNNENILGFINPATTGDPNNVVADLSGAPAGECHIWGWSYRGESDPVLGQNISTLADGACEAISSNFIRVIREECSAMCPTPSNLTITNIDPKRTRADWDKVEGAAKYKIEIRFGGETRVVGRGLVRGNGVYIFGPAGRDYEIRVKTICQDGSESDYTDWLAYSTPPKNGLVAIIAQGRSNETFKADIEILEEPITKIAMYPNPVSNLLNVSYLTSSATGVLSVYHISGKQVSITKLAKEEGYHQVNLTNLPDGAYLITIEEEGKLPHTQRIIKGSF